MEIICYLSNGYPTIESSYEMQRRWKPVMITTNTWRAWWQ